MHCFNTEPLDFVFVTGFHPIAQAGLELTIWPRLVPNSRQSPCLSFLSTGLTNMNHHLILGHCCDLIP